ncbi:MAG: cell division protein FtsA [Thermodesulfovibrionales bacterium]|nr:cell division protein FtsA [Thermodesulfovibrionales bacterium]
MRQRNRNSNIVAALDIGTTKICAIVGEVHEDGINVLSVSSYPSHGIRKGIVVDIEAAVNSIKKAVASAGEQTGIPISKAYIGIAGNHIKGFDSYGAIGINGREVSHEDVERAINSASAVNMPLDREILHVFPTDFILDGQEGIKDPVGMAGVKLEVNVYIVTGAVASVQNLLKCCELSGLEVVDLILQPLASAEITLTNDEREIGVALVDIGGGTSDIVIYKNGWMRHTAVVGIGGNHFTNDISIGLKIPFDEAERVKKKYGTMLSETDDMTEIEIVSIDGQVKHIPARYISEIIQPRGEELLELVREEINMSNNNGVEISRIVFTGGSSLLLGIDRMAEAILSMPVRIGYPQLNCHDSLQNKIADISVRDYNRNYDIQGLKTEFNSPMYSTGIGLLLYGADTIMHPDKAASSSGMFNRIVNNVIDWFKRIKGK